MSVHGLGGAVSHSQWKQRDSDHRTETRRDRCKQFCAHAGLDIIPNSPPCFPHLSFSERERVLCNSSNSIWRRASKWWGSLWLRAFGSNIMCVCVLCSLNLAYLLLRMHILSLSLSFGHPHRTLQSQILSVSFYCRKQESENKILLNQ